MKYELEVAGKHLARRDKEDTVREERSNNDTEHVQDPRK